MKAAALAGRQHGVLSRAQALKCGVSREAVRHHLLTGRWQRVFPGVYFTSSGTISWEARASAAVLHAGPGAALILQSAAYLWQLQDNPPPVIAVGVPHHRRVVRVVGTRIRRRRRLETVEVRRLPVTPMAQTVIDLAAEPGWTVDEAVALAARAAQRGKVTGQQLLAELEPRTRHPHKQVLQLAFGDIDEGVQSTAEWRFVHAVQRAHGLPELRRQTGAADGGACDFRSVEHGVIIEIDGQWWHAGERFGKDRKRDRRAARLGDLTLRAGWYEVTVEPCELALDIGLTLQQRGWTGRVSPCGGACAVNRVA